MKTPCIPHYFFYSISKNYCTNFKPLFLAKRTYVHYFPFFYLKVDVVGDLIMLCT